MCLNKYTAKLYEMYIKRKTTEWGKYATDITAKSY